MPQAPLPPSQSTRQEDEPGQPARAAGAGLRRGVLALIGAGLLATGGLAGAALTGSKERGAQRTLEQTVNTFSMAKAKKTKVGYQYWFFNKKAAQGRTLKMTAVGPRQKSHPPHKHDGHEFFYVLEGTAEFFLNGQKRVVGPNTGLYCPPWSLHGIANAGDTQLKYLVIKEYVDEMSSAH